MKNPSTRAAALFFGNAHVALPQMPFSFTRNLSQNAGGKTIANS